MTQRANCASFHNDKDLALCTPDGVLHLWDAEKGSKKAEFTPSSHLTSTFTCLSWKVHRQKEARKNASRKRAKSISTEKEDIIALGTATGEILIYHVQMGELIGKLEKEHTDKVNCICWDFEEYRLFSCSDDQNIVHWDLKSYKSLSKWSGDKHKVSCICIGPHSTLLSAGKTIKLWDLETKECLRRFTGHSSPVLSMSFIYMPGNTQKKDSTAIDLVEGMYFLSTAIEDRVASAWQIQKKHRKIAVATFGLTSEPVAMAIKSPTGRDQPTCLLVLTDEGEVNLFSHTLNGQLKKPLEVQMSVKVVDPTAKQLKILSASFCECEHSESRNILIAYGTTVRVACEKLNLDEFEMKDVCIIREDPMKLEVAVNKDSVKLREPIRTKEDVTTLVPGVPGHSQKIGSITEHEPRLKSKRKKTISVNEAEMTMEDQINAISVQNEGGDKPEPPRSDSLCVLLTQGLQSNDKEILNRVLQHTNENLIHNTVRRLPISLVVSLLQDLTERLQGTPAAAFKFIKWLRETLKVHASYLMTYPDLVPLLSQLYQMMNARAQTHSKFLKLEGKLDMIVSQIKSRKNSQMNSNDVDTSPLFVYEDESSDEQEDIVLDELPADNMDSSDSDWDALSEKDESNLMAEDPMDLGEENLVNGMMEED